jgi:hypothetical protein
MSKRKPEWNEYEPLTSAVADAIATADVNGATYEDLARAAVSTYAATLRKLNVSMLRIVDSTDQEDDGA